LKASLARAGLFHLYGPERAVPAACPRGLEWVAPASATPGSRTGDRVLFWAPIFESLARKSGAFSFAWVVLVFDRVALSPGPSPAFAGEGSQPSARDMPSVFPSPACGRGAGERVGRLEPPLTHPLNAIDLYAIRRAISHPFSRCGRPHRPLTIGRPLTYAQADRAWCT